MERKKDVVSMEIKVGITAAVALIFFAVIIMTIEKFRFGQKGYPIYVSFDFVDALNPQSDVVIGGGVKIGQVDTITTLGEKINLRIIIHNHIKIPSDAKFQILSKGLMGDKYVNVIPQTLTKDFLKPGAQVEGVEPTNIDKAFRRFGQLADSARILLGDPEMKTSIVDMLKNFSSLSQRLDKLVKRNESNLNQSARDFSEAMKNVKSFSEDLNQLSGGMRSVLAEKNSQNLEVLLQNLRQTSERLDAEMKKISEGEGVLGKLIEDEQMADDLKSMIRDLKENPWKLLWKK